MGNHFHLLVRIKEKEEIGYYAPLNSDRSDDSVRFKKIVDADLSASDEGRPDRVNTKIPDSSKHFSHLFNAYSKYYNLRYARHGSLFERPFKRKRIDSEVYLKQVVIYIHNNPVHHSFCNHALEYSWSSYLSFLTEKTTKINRKKVYVWFENTDHFQIAHSSSDIAEKIERFLGL
jgi:putative transposase